MKNKNFILQFIPVMLAFFAMGTVDLVGIASNYVKEDFGLSDQVGALMVIAALIAYLFFLYPVVNVKKQ